MNEHVTLRQYTFSYSFAKSAKAKTETGHPERVMVEVMNILSSADKVRAILGTVGCYEDIWNVVTHSEPGYECRQSDVMEYVADIEDDTEETHSREWNKDYVFGFNAPREMTHAELQAISTELFTPLFKHLDKSVKSNKTISEYIEYCRSTQRTFSV